MTDSAAPKFETCIDSREAFTGVFLKVQQDTVQLPEGGTAIREYIRHPGAVAILAVLPNGKLLLENSSATHCNASFWKSLPARSIRAKTR